VRRLRTALALIGPLVFAGLVVAALALYMHGHTIAVLQPSGDVARQERRLMDLAIVLSIIVVVPVFALAIFIAWRYRETNPRPKKYQPEWDHSRVLEGFWWGVPSVIIVVLSVVTWVSSYHLDPYKELSSTKAPLHVQVVAMDWKWLFIYPEQHVASVNELYMPVGQPVHFDITSDTVMNSFWIPSLGSQIYAMPGMSTKLHLVADKSGEYPGSSANISGRGFAGMTFMAKAGPQAGFEKWIAHVQAGKRSLSMSDYDVLARPSTYNKVAYYSSVQKNLYYELVQKYMSHMETPSKAPLLIQDDGMAQPDMNMMEHHH
jgi:cytochrome o ubiquinol oxidase subunit 2